MAEGLIDGATAQDAKTIEYTTGLTPPTFEPQRVFDLTDPEQPKEYLEQNKTRETRERERALAEASVRMLFATDVSKLDDAGVKGLYQSVTEGVWGMPDAEGAFFGKRGSATDFRRNVDLLRQFFKGNYKLAEDPEAEEFRRKTWDEKFRYALEHETAGNALASTVGGERGATLGEMVFLSVAAGNDGMTLPPPGGDPNAEARREVSRKMNYETMTPEEKRKYEADVIGDYERKLAKREPLYTYVRMAADLSDEGAYILAKSYNDGALDVPNIMGLPEDEQAKVMTTYAQMKGDLREGKLLGLVPMDFSTGTTGDRVQMGIYGLQQSVVSLGTDLYRLAENAAMWSYAKMALDGKERADFFKGWDAISAAELYEKQGLPEAESFGGEAFQSFMENVHWIIPYGGAAKLAKWAKGAGATIHAADLAKEVKAAGKLADLREMMNVSLFSRLSPVPDGMKFADETINRLLTSVDKYTREIRQLDRMRLAYGAGKGALEGAWVAARGSAFAAFAQEYLETADAAGISREESVLTAAWVGLLNDRIEQLYVPGLESTLTKGQLKSLGMAAMRRSLQEGTFGEFAKNFMTRYLAEGVRVGVTEGWIEEPLQQLVLEHGKAVDQVEGLGEKLKALLKFSSKDLQAYIETAADMLPASFGFGVTSVPGQLMRRRIRNKWNARKTGLVNYDEGIVGLYQRELDVRKLVEASWNGEGEKEAERQDAKPTAEGEEGKEERDEGQGEHEGEAEESEEQDAMRSEVETTDALTRARALHETDDGSGDLVGRVAQEIGVDVKTAEAVVQLLDEEAEAMRFDPRVRSMVDRLFSGVRINEKTISTLLPGYVAGSFEADEENGVYVAKVRIGEDGGIAGGVKTIVYRRRDGVFFNPDGTLNEAELARAASPNSTLGVSYNRRVRQEGGTGLLWEQLPEADRRREALIIVNGRTDETGSVAFRRKDGTEVAVRADAIINLATGRLADIGYGMAAKQSTVRHETFHALWKFAKELVKPEEAEKLAAALAIDTKAEGWERDLDEAMAHQMEEYASGHYVVNAVSSRFEAFQAWAAKAFGGVDANAVLDVLPESRKDDLSQLMGEGSPFALRSFYDAVLGGKIGSGELGIERIVVPAKPGKADMRAQDELPVEGAKEEPKPEDKPVGEPKPEEKPAQQPTDVMQRPSWDHGTTVTKRVPKKDYRIHCRLEVVNIHDGIRTSWSEGFDQANQGRDITSEESASTVEAIAGNPDYSKGGAVMEFTGTGAPLVSPTGDVLDGNHHMRGLQLAYERGGEKIEAFRESVLAEAKARGLEVSEHAAEAPIIVCIVESVETNEGEAQPTVAQIAEDTNDTVQRGLNTYEQAAKDARILIANGLIPRFEIDSETGLIKDEDEKRANGKVVNPIGIFRQKSGAQGLVDESNHVTEEGQKRLMNGILAALLGGTNPKVVQAIMEKSKHLDMENEMRALMRLAPQLLALVNDPAKKEYDLRPEILEALTWYQEWRNKDEEERAKAGKSKADWRKIEARPTNWANFRGDMFAQPSPTAAILGDLFAAAQSERSFQQDGETDTKAGSKRAQDLIIREIEAYLRNVYATNTDTADIFGDYTPPTKDQILQTQREKNARYSVALYHGTGADFEEPSLDHLGEGTGRAAQGHGFYTTDDQGWAEFWSRHNNNAGFMDSIIGRGYVYQFEYDGDEQNLAEWIGPNPEAAQRLMKVARDEGLETREWMLADPDHTTGVRMERFLETAKKPDGSKLTRGEMGELFVKAGIDGVKEFVGTKAINTYVFYNLGKLKNVHKWHGKRQMFSVALKPNPIPAEKVEEIVKKFGVTDNVEESLWLMPDGRMLKGEPQVWNFGGRKVTSFGHDALTPYVVGPCEEGEDVIAKYDAARARIFASGFIRMTGEGDGFYVAKRPTEAQFDALYDICDKSYQRMDANGIDTMYVDVEDGNANRLFSLVYRRGTSARRMIEDLKGWYDEGVVPEAAQESRYSVGKLYTGSAADYDRPSVLKIGTGEGSTAYGWGLYATDNLRIAELYADADATRRTEPFKALYRGKSEYAFPRASKERDALRGLTKFGSVNETIAEIERTYGEMEYAQEVKRWIEEHRSEITYTEPARQFVYEQTWWTNREPGDDSHLLSWYEPIGEGQLKTILEGVKREFGVEVTATPLPSGALQFSVLRETKWGKMPDPLGARFSDEVTGRDAYRFLAEALGSEKAASEALCKVGIDGIKYPANSYGKPIKDGNAAGWNYVAFSDEHLRVDHKWVDGKRRYSTARYNPRADVPKVRGGWTEQKIVRYLKTHGSLTGEAAALRLMAEFDSPEELKAHMFYHGTSNWIDGGLKPSVIRSDNWRGSHGGGGYGLGYWGVSVSRSKRRAANFSGTAHSVSVHPIVLAKSAKVVDRPDYTDAADVEDEIVQLWTDGVDAVRIGKWDSEHSEEELLVLNPRAIADTGNSSTYKVYNLGGEDNEIDVRDDAQIRRMFEYAKSYDGLPDFGMPRKPSRYTADWAERKPDDVYEREMAEYAGNLREWQMSEGAKRRWDAERERDDMTRWSVGKTWEDWHGNAHLTLHRLIPQKRHSESQMEGVKNQHELDLLKNHRRERLFRMTREEAYANLLEIGRISVASDQTRSDFYEWARGKTRPEMEEEIRSNVTDARIEAVVGRVRETGATSVVGVGGSRLETELVERVVEKGGFARGASDRTAVVGLGTGTGVEFMKAVERVIDAGGRAVGLVSLYRDGAAGNESIFADDVECTPQGTRLVTSRYGDLHDVLRILAKRMGGHGGMSASDLKEVPGYDAAIEVFARTPKRELRWIVANVPWRLSEMLTDFAETEAFVRIALAKGTKMAARQKAADRHAIASRPTSPSELGVNPANGGRVINGGQLSTYRGERTHFVPGEDMFRAVSVDDWDFVTKYADVDPAEATLVADRIIDGRLSDLMDGIVASAKRGPWINLVYPDKGKPDVLTSRLAYRISQELSALGWFVRRSRVEVEVDYAGKAAAKVSIKSVAGQLVYVDSLYDSATSVAAISAMKPVMTEGSSVVFATLAVAGSDRFAISDEELARKIETAKRERKTVDGNGEGRSEARAAGAPGNLHGGWELVRTQLESGGLQLGAQPLPGGGEEAPGGGLRRVHLKKLYGSLTDALGYDVRKTTGAELEGLVSAIAGGVWPEGLDSMRLRKVAETTEDLELPERSPYQMVRFSTRLSRAKRIAILKPKSAIPQMEFDFFCDRKGITEKPKAEQKGSEPPKKGKRYKEAVADANAYQRFIDRYRPLYEAAVRRGDWGPALDFAEENDMPVAGNVLKQYYRDPQFNMTELAGMKIGGVEDAAAVLMMVRSPFVESVKAIYLDRQRRILDAKILTVGQAGESAISRGTVVRNMSEKTAYVILSHNHPSGDPSPSAPDKHLTMELKKELKAAKVKLLDHIITDGDHFYSFNYQDVLPVDVKTPKWEVLPAVGNQGTAFRTHQQILEYAAAHLRDDGESGHVIYVNSQMGVVGVRRVPSVTAYRGDGNGDRYAEWAKLASEGAEAAGATSVIVDLGPTPLVSKEARRILQSVGPWFGVKGVGVVDAICGSAAMGEIHSLRCDLDNGKEDWTKLVPNAEEIDNEDRFYYPRYSIASRKIDWQKVPDSLENVVLSTTVAHLTGQDKFPEKYLYFKAYRDRGLLDQVRKTVEGWAKDRATHWFGTYLLAKYYGDLEAAKLVVRHHMHQKKTNVLTDYLKKAEPVKAGVVSEPQPVRWVYVRNDDGKRTNRIPEAYAGLLAERFGGVVDTGIVKVSDERNTGAKIKSRVGREFQFAGEPAKGSVYVIVDDVWTTGQTAVSLMEYLGKKGANVAAITTLAVASNGSRIKPTGDLIGKVLAKGHVDSVERAEEITGVDLRKATGSELQAYIVKGRKGAFGLESWFGSAAPVLPLDFADKGTKKGRATRFDLFAHLTAEQRKRVSTKPVQGAFAFSTAFPHLSDLGDDSLIAAALASRLALDQKDRMIRSLKFDTVRKMVKKAYPTLADGPLQTKVMNVHHDALKLARKIREGLDRGVSESAILKALNDTLKPTFESGMRKEAREGAKVGAYGAHAEDLLEQRSARIFDKAIRVQAGVDADLFEAWAGVDFTETLWKVLHNAYAENQPAPRKPEPVMPEDEGAGGGDEGAPRDPTTYAVKELENPRTFAEYIRDLAGKYWKQERGLGEAADPWQDRIAVQFLRRTAQNVFTKLVNELTYSRSRDTAYRAIQKMENIPTVRGLVSQMAYVGEIIHARHVRETQQELCEKLDALLKTQFGATGRFKADKEELKRKVSAEMELRARYMRHAMWLTPDAVSEEAGELSRALTSMATDYGAADRDIEQSRIYVETIRKLHILREFGGLKYKPVGEIERALAYWEEQAAGSADEILRAFEDREARTKTAAAILAKAFFNPKLKRRVDKGFRQGMNNYLTAHMGFASLLQDMCRFASEKDRAEAYRIIEYLAREIQKAGDRSAAEMRRHGDEFHKAVEQIYGMPFKKVMAAMNREDPAFLPFMCVKGGHPVTPTKGRAMQLLVSLLQGEKKNSNYYENVRHWKREGQAAQIAALLTAQDMNMVKWLGQWYEANRQELSDVCEALFGIGVYSEAYNYFPVKMLLQRQGLEKVEGVAWTVFPKALTPRIRNLRDFDTEADIFAMWASRMEEAAQWKGHAKLGLELRGIFGRSELQEVVAANHGSRVNSLMLGFITDILAGHGAYDRTTSGIEWWSDQIRGWTALCALGGNVGVTFKQTTSIPAFGFEIGLVKTARYTVSAFTPGGFEAMRRIFASEQRKTRWQVGNTEAVKNALARNDASWFKRAMQASMITNKVGDIVPGLVVGQGIYRDCLARGMSEENAMAQTWMLIERTQQSGRMENQTSVQRRNRLGRMLYQFHTTQQQYLQSEVRAIRQAVADPSLKNAAQVANTILLNHFVLSSLYYWMGELYKAMLGSEPPKDQIADWVVSCLLGPFASLYVLGFCSKVTLDRFLKGSWTANGEDMLPMESFIKRTIDDAGRVIEAVFDEEKSTDELIEELARLAAGMNPVVRDIRRVKKNMEE